MKFSRHLGGSSAGGRLGAAVLSSVAHVQEGDRRLPLWSGGGLFVLSQVAGHLTSRWR